MTRAMILTVPLLITALVPVLRSTSVLAQTRDFPTKPITWLVPYAPGGGFDIQSRAIARGMKNRLGVPVIVKNIPGAGGVIGWNMLWVGQPDGYTVAIVNIPGAVVSELFGKVKPQFRLRELSWIGRLSTAPYMWAAGANTPYRNLEGLRKVKEILIADVGVGATSWVTAVLTAHILNFKAKFILGYPSAPAATMATVKGEGEARALGMDAAGQMQFVHAGKMIPLWVYLDQRDPEFPNVPTVGELGHPELAVLASHRVVAAPPGMPVDRLETLRQAFSDATRDPEVEKAFQKMGAKMTPVIGKQWESILAQLFDLMERYSSLFREAMP